MFELPWVVRHGDEVYRAAAWALFVLALVLPFVVRARVIARRANRVRRAFGTPVGAMGGVTDGAEITLRGILRDDADGTLSVNSQPGRVTIEVGTDRVTLEGVARVVLGRNEPLREGSAIEPRRLRRGDRVLARGRVSRRADADATTNYRAQAARWSLHPTTNRDAIELAFDRVPRAVGSIRRWQFSALALAAMTWMLVFVVGGEIAYNHGVRDQQPYFQNGNVPSLTAATIWASACPLSRMGALSRLQRDLASETRDNVQAARWSNAVVELDQLLGRCDDGVIESREHGQFAQAIALSQSCGDRMALRSASSAAYAAGRFRDASALLEAAFAGGHEFWTGDHGEAVNSQLTLDLLGRDLATAARHARMRTKHPDGSGWNSSRRLGCFADALDARAGDANARARLAREGTTLQAFETVDDLVCGFLWADLEPVDTHPSVAETLGQRITGTVATALGPVEMRELIEAVRTEREVVSPAGRASYGILPTVALDTGTRTVGLYGFFESDPVRSELAQTRFRIQRAALDALADDDVTARMQAQDLIDHAEHSLAALRAKADLEARARAALPDSDTQRMISPARDALTATEGTIRDAGRFIDDLPTHSGDGIDPAGLHEGEVAHSVLYELYKRASSGRIAPWIAPNGHLLATEFRDRWEWRTLARVVPSVDRNRDELVAWFHYGAYPRCEHCTVLELLADTGARLRVAEALGDVPLANSLRESLAAERAALRRRDIAMPLALLEMLPDR